MAQPGRGALIVFEGLDRSGKSTQCERLCRRIESMPGCKVTRMRFPDRTTPIGKTIDAYLKGDTQQEDHVIHLLFSANRWEAVAHIDAEIAKGASVVVDRYYYSGMVYSAAKDRPDLTLQWAREPDVGLPRPDLCFFLDVSPEVAAQRGGFGVEKYENDKMQRRVRELFHEIRQSSDGEDMRVIDAGKSLDEVEDDIFAVMSSPELQELVKKPLRRIESWS